MDINLNNLDDVTKAKYMVFQNQVENLLTKYQREDKDRFDSVSEKLADTKGEWTTNINILRDGISKSVDISQLLAYEYCLATEKVTNGKVTFETALEKLFDGVTKFRIGNPVPGKDDECLYGKGFGDSTAIPVTSKKYRLVMNAGAQHLDYIKDGKKQGAVFIYKKQLLKGFGKDEQGNPVDYPADGIDFDDLSQGQSLLTNLRQTAFHEWNHNAEKEIIEETPQLDYEYVGQDGKTYRNYEKINDYYEYDTSVKQEEPEYVKSDELDERGFPKVYGVSKDGTKTFLGDINFGLVKKQLPQELAISTGLTTVEVLPNGNTKIHNMITEGFVEKIAREMVKAVDPEVKDIDEGKYSSYAKVADRVIAIRDKVFGENGSGQTIADFLTHSTTLKKDLESRTAVRKDGSKIDGLHFISDLAERLKRDNSINIDEHLQKSNGENIDNPDKNDDDAR